jgi:type VI secretion system protein ImpJ
MNVRVFFEGDRMDGFEVAPIAELVAPAPGLPMTRLNPAFIPPSVRIGATEAATSLMKEVYAEAAAKASELAGAATAADVIAGNATEAELIQLWKLMVLRSALPGLREASDAGLHHPYDVHVQLCSLLGQFVTLSAGRSAPTIPPYDHNALGACLHEVADALLELLRADHLAANFRRIPLSRGDLPFGGLGMGAQSVDAQLLNSRNEIYVAFNNPSPSGPERDWYRSGHMKIAAATRISDVVVQRKYGVPAIPCPKPRALPARANALYYRLRIDPSAGPEARAEWEAIKTERTVVIHFATKGLVPGEPAPDLAMEAYVVFGR